MTTQPTDWDSAINRINRLLDETESLKADLEQALSLLEKHGWEKHEGDDPTCVECGFFAWAAHHPDCLWANLLSRYGREVRFHD